MTFAKMQTWFPGIRSEKEKEVALKLTQTYYEYHKPGFGQCAMTFLKNGLIGAGKGELEQYWDIYIKGDHICLEIFSNESRTLICLLCADGSWRGYQEVQEETDIELTPVRPLYTTFTITSPRHPGPVLPPPPIIHAQLSGQLGNCLRNILSTNILADSIGAKWDVDLNQSAVSAEVVKIIRLLFPDKVKSYPHNTYMNFPEEKLMSFLSIYGTNSHPLIEATIDSIPSFIFGTRHIYSARPAAMPGDFYIRQKLKLYHSMIWPPVIIKSIENYIKNQACGSLSDFIGVHIRYTDNFSDSLKCSLNLNTDISTFIDKLKTVQDNPVLLCTDNPDIRKLIKKELPQLKIIFPDQIDPLFQPLYEMHLLSKTKYVIGSFSSTFSYEACFLTGTDLEVYEKGNWKKYNIKKFTN